MSSWRPNADDSSRDSDEDDEYDESLFTGRDAFIFLIDAFLSEDTDAFEECFQLIEKALLNTILMKNKDLIGIVFYNTKFQPNPKDMEGIKNIVIKNNTAVLLPLRQLSKDIVSYYLNFSKSGTDHFDFKNVYGCATGDFANALWLCTNMFKQSGFKLETQTIINFTNKDKPPDVDSGNFQKIIKKASDLNEVDIGFNVIPLKDDFDYDKFYKEFICTVEDIDLEEFEMPDIMEEKEKFSRRQFKQDFKKKCISHLKFGLGDNLEMSVSIYNYFRKNVEPKSVKVLKDNNSIVNVKRILKLVRLNEDSMEIDIEKEHAALEQRKVITIGGEKISFTNDELAKLRSPLMPGITLLGFRSQNEISIHNFIRSPSFIYPDEKVIEGSTKLFYALWQICIEKDLIAFCILVSKRKSQPRYVALIPTSSPGSCHDDYDGFKVVYLPFEIDYKDIDLSGWNSPTNVTDEQVEIFEKMIKKMKFRYASTKFHDPFLLQLRTDLIELAFDIKLVEEDGDDTLYEKQDEVIEPFLSDLKELFGEVSDAETQKRKAHGTLQMENKKSKTDNTSNDLTEEQINQFILDNSLNDLTIKQLKTYLQTKNVKGISSATKPKLIEKIMELHS